MNVARQEHWEAVYGDKGGTQTSWFRRHVDESLRLIDVLVLPPNAPPFDVGGCATLTEALLTRGFRDTAALAVAFAPVREKIKVAMHTRLRLVANSH